MNGGGSYSKITICKQHTQYDFLITHRWAAHEMDQQLVHSLLIITNKRNISSPYGNSRQIRETNIFPPELASAGEASSISDI
ncbi:hypothetical protein CDAR_204321 [Caerostris darwini]|uniref:Ycf15 n=1 Tax=Caerostris darwini TaxID=1538125 RepID=A0AAV4USL0_9ARAC|nr:hypothetical protein CDAR_204321 [Caerostris darwini]